MRMDREQFEQLVQEAVDELPDKFAKKLHNVAIFVEDFPSPEQMEELHVRSKYGLFGLFEGYAQGRRLNFGPILPDRITIFRMPILKSCLTVAACRRQVISTVKHEIAHHFGLGEAGARRAGAR